MRAAQRDQTRFGQRRTRQRGDRRPRGKMRKEQRPLAGSKGTKRKDITTKEMYKDDDKEWEEHVQRTNKAKG